MPEEFIGDRNLRLMRAAMPGILRELADLVERGEVTLVEIERDDEIDALHVDTLAEPVQTRTEILTVKWRRR